MIDNLDEAMDYKNRLRTQPPAIYNHRRINERPYPNTDHPELELDAASHNNLPNINNVLSNSVVNSTEVVSHNSLNGSNGSQAGQIDVENNSEGSLLEAISRSNENNTSTESFFSTESTNNSNILEKSRVSNITETESESELVSQINSEDVSFIGISSSDQMELSYLLHLSADENDGQYDSVCDANEQTTSMYTPSEISNDCDGASGSKNINNDSADDDSDVELVSVGPKGFPKPQKYCNEIVHTKYENDQISGKLPFATKVYCKATFYTFSMGFFNVKFVYAFFFLHRKMAIAFTKLKRVQWCWLRKSY